MQNQILLVVDDIDDGLEMEDGAMLKKWQSYTDPIALCLQKKKVLRA